MTQQHTPAPRAGHDSIERAEHDSLERAKHDSLERAGSRPRAKRDRLLQFVRVGQTHVGRGVFARRRLKADMVLGEILGTVLDEHPADPSYCMEVRSGRVLEPDPPLRFVNHSCDPNCELFYWTDDEGPEEDRLWLQTIRSIEPGEELSIDYCWPADAAIPCRCGAAVCRGWIVDPDERHLLAATPTESLSAGDGPPSPPSSS